MTPFNPKKKKILTIGEALDPAMQITTEEDARHYKAAYVAYLEQFLTNGVNDQGMTAEEIANSNLGYYAGYGSNELRERVERLFKCSHPVFGSIKENGAPTPKQAFELGKKIGLQNKLRG
jgi:hypothetical protein